MDQSPNLGRRFVAILAALVSLAACSGNTPDTSKPKSRDTWWESEPKLAPKNFKQLVAETVSIDGGEVTGDDVKVSIPAGALNEDAQLSIRKPLGKFGSEIGGPIVGLEHDKDLNGPIAVEWNVASLTPAQQRTLLIVRWNNKQQRWVPSPVEPNIADGILRAELTEWSFSSWIADRGQTGQEILGRRVDAPKCKDGKLHDWVRSVVDPDEETTAASVRVCFENDRDEIVTMRIANNRPFGQFIHMDGSSGWEWAWSGKSDVSAVQLVRTGAAAVFNNDNRIFVPPLQEVAVGIARPDTGGSHFIEFRNQYTTETILADVIMFAMSNVDVPAAGTEKVGVFVEALIECAFQGIVRGGPPTDLEATARSIVSSVVTCVGTITDETSELGLAFRTKISKRIAEMSGPDAASEAIKHDRTLRRISGVFKLLVVAEIITYLNDLYQESRVGELRWSIRGNGTASPLGEWTPNCNDINYDSNQIYRNVALQDEFADTSRELHEFPGWKAASTKAVAPLSTCPEDYLPKLSERVRTSWGDPKAAAIVANAVVLIGAKSPTTDIAACAVVLAADSDSPSLLADGWVIYSGDRTQQITGRPIVVVSSSDGEHYGYYEVLEGSIAYFADDTGELVLNLPIEERITQHEGSNATGSTCGVPPPPLQLDPEGLNFVQSPSGNIVCLIQNVGATCEIRDFDFELPPPPSSCDLDFGPSMGVSANAVGFDCVGDTFFGPDYRVLEYGQSASVGGFTCLSEQTGMRCDNGSGKGFNVRRTGYEFFDG